MIMWNFDNFSQNIAFADDAQRSLTYGELAEFTERVGKVVPSRSLVFLFCTNTIGSAALYAAFIENKIVPVMCKADLDTGLTKDLLETYHPDFVAMPRQTMMGGGGIYIDVILEYEGYVVTRTENSHTKLFPDLALLMTTSGSTGSAKLVRQSYKSISANTTQIVHALGITQNDRAITTLPMNYTYGLSILNTHLATGATLLLTEQSVLRGEFWKFFDEAEATTFGGVPYTYEILSKMGFLRKTPPRSLRYITQSGGKSNPAIFQALAEWAAKNGVKFFPMYGQSEATTRITILPSEMALEKIGSVGLPLGGERIYLLDENGEQITTPNTVGELCAEGENVSLGYAQCLADLAKGDEWRSVLRTGDLAKFDGDGCLYIVGRLKRFLKIFGSRVSLDEVETAVKKQFPEIPLACGGRDDSLKIYIEGECDRAQEIRQFVSQKTAIALSAVSVVCVEKIPRNEAGKVLYAKLEERE